MASEARHRRGIFYAGDLRAAAETERFVAEHLIRARSCDGPRATLRYALELASIDGMALEFGVAGGTTLRSIVSGLPGREIYGFDVFTGLPEDWRPRFARGKFAQPTIPEVPGATLVEGLFGDTLPSFLEGHPGNVAFVHLDADLYTSTKTVLDLLGDRLVPGTVVLLDEYFNYPGWQDGEYRAWEEFATQQRDPVRLSGLRPQQRAGGARDHRPRLLGRLTMGEVDLVTQAGSAGSGAAIVRRPGVAKAQVNTARRWGSRCKSGAVPQP